MTACSPASGSCFNTVPVMRSNPGDLLGHSLLMVAWISFFVKFLRGVGGRPGRTGVVKTSRSSFHSIAEE